jgi:DNA polymerase III epsilon subunit-like protein
MRVLGIDFETQDDNATTTRVTEVGAVLVEVNSRGLFIPVEKYRTLCYEPDYPPQTDAIVELTGITDEAMKMQGINRRRAFNHIITMMEKADLVVAHNKAFDETVFRSTCQLLGAPVPDKRWLCTLSEVPYPEKYTCKKLSHLAWEHDLPVDRSKLHRADYDVEVMLMLLEEYDLDKVLAYANEPWVYLQAVFPAPWTDGGVGKAKAQKMRFGWEKAHGDDRIFTKAWVKRVKQSKVEDELIRAERLNLTIRTIQ